VKPLLPVLLAGGTFAAGAVIGLGGGVLAAQRFGEPLLAPVGLMIGAGFGGYSAVRMLLRSIE
jgi:hypothetical protein